MVEVSDIHKKLLRRAKSADEYNLYRAGLEWDLTEPIVIESEADFKSAPRWQERLKPFQHQVTNLITFCRRLPVTLLADDVGLGKTISAGLIISELVSRSRISKVLVVCPKILGPQWQSELESKFDIPAKFVTGRDLLTADFEEHGVVITTYNSARLYLDQIPDDRFQMLVLDEAHKLRNLYGVEKPPQVAKCFHAALQARRFRYVLMLTATPIHNRLWDLYSLVDLLTVGRGHQNPFGTPGMFARRFIADDKEKARQLREEAIEEFRSIVYGYMSRVRRGDAKLYFPDRLVERRQVDPTEPELQLIKTIAKPIQKMNRLVQISILKALASSPEALNSMLKNMVRNGTAPKELSSAVNDIVENMPLTAKLRGLGQLIEQLKKQNPDRWRLIVFTGLRETQTTIQNFLESNGLKVGLINGESGSRNQETIERFRANPPLHRVIVSTEAGAEGVNLQAANILVNFDLPWNPMIVEQRIGRIQRLGSEYENVVVYNLTLRNTFEDYIVGRLMEKLQMASNAIGDIDSLLQGVDGSDEDEGEAFEDRLLELVLAALQGKDKERAAQLEVANIEEAIETLERERETIKGLLDGGEDNGYVGPRAPTLPSPVRSMHLQGFTLIALAAAGMKVTPHPPDLYSVDEGRGRHLIRFKEASASNLRSTLYNESSGAFQRLVDQTIATGMHLVDDNDKDIESRQLRTLTEWANSFGGTIRNVEIESARRRFKGSALVRVRATVLHDSYERLVDVPCKPDTHVYQDGPTALRALAPNITDIGEVGINLNKIAEAIDLDEGIAEFSRFYLERREHEVRYASGDERKERKLYDEFTPRFEATVVSLSGEIARDVTSRVQFIIDQGEGYDATVTVRPSTEEIIDAPQQDLCTKSGRKVPRGCLTRCEITGAKALRHLLAKSELSGRVALPEYVEVCSVSGKKALTDEIGTSDITGRKASIVLLQRCEVTGKLAEKSYFGTCAFSNSAVLRSELIKSEISGRSFRRDQNAVSAYSGKVGHQQEFISCFETTQLVANNEAERCQESNQLVRPGILLACEETGIRARPSLLERCSETGKLGLKRLLVSSSLSQMRILKSCAIKSTAGDYCGQAEAVECAWSGEKYHPSDLGVCELTGLNVHQKFLGATSPFLIPLVDLLNNYKEPTTETQYPLLENALARKLNGAKCRIISGAISPTNSTLAMCAEAKSMLGLKSRILGFVFRPDKKEVIGKVAVGKRTKERWVRTAS